jgi:class 3 adenylate cyclase
MNASIDIRAILPTITVPTLVVNRTGDPVADVEAARDMAAHIPGARFVEFPGETHSLSDIADESTTEVRAFLTGVHVPAPARRVLASILAVDIVGSTELASRIGDAAWRDLLERWYARVGSELAAHGGWEVDRAGDGLLATFEGPSRAIRCAVALTREAAALGLRLRAGVHTGEVETVDGGVRGVSVHLAARVASAAGPGDVLVSGTVRDLIAGSGILLRDRGLHELKGIDGPRQLFEVA